MTKTTTKKTKTKAYKLPNGKSLVLRVCRADMSSSHGFVWPRSGRVEAPDWRATSECGHGLHGWLWGVGDITCTDLHAAPDAVYLVVEVETSALVDLAGKVKFRRGLVVYAGARDDAVRMVQTHAPVDAGPFLWGTATAGDAGTATAGNGGTATAGNRGTATAGLYGCIAIEWWDAALGAYRKAVAEVDGERIKPGVAYVVRDGRFVAKDAP